MALNFQAALGCIWGIEEKIGRKLACLAKHGALGLSPTSGELSLFRRSDHETECLASRKTGGFPLLEG